MGGSYAASGHFDQACSVDPEFDLGHAAHARALMMEGRLPEARAALERAKRLTAFASPRECAHIAAYAALFSGATEDCRLIVRAHAIDFPKDPMMMQLLTNVFGLIGFSGKIGREADLLAFTTQLMPHYKDDWWMMSMHGASLCETGHLDEAMALLSNSLDLNPQNSHAAHFFAHTQYEVGETKEGRQFLANWLGGHEDLGVLRGHLTWHSALWALEQGDVTAMWQAIDKGIWPHASSSLPINVLTDSASTLYRAKIAGVEVPKERWRSLSNYAAQFFPDTGQSFADIHVALCHAMAGDGERLARISEGAKGYAGDLVRLVSTSWGHIARQNWQAALECLTGVMTTHERLGGSRAQRDLLELAFANVLLKLGRAETARRTLKTNRPILCNGDMIKGLGSH